jgi:hypothetical protein
MWMRFRIFARAGGALLVLPVLESSCQESAMTSSLEKLHRYVRLEAKCMLPALKDGCLGALRI